MPKQFDEVVDIVVSDSRAKGDEWVNRFEREEERKKEEKREHNQEEGEAMPKRISYEDVLENMDLKERDEKPFWMKFLKSDYGKDLNDDQPMLP